mgnify:FL=1
MLVQKNYPTVFVDDGATLTDVSFDALSFGRDAFSCEITAAGNYLYFGRYKPFAALYVEMGTANTQAQSEFLIEYWNGSAWAGLTDSVIDDTKGFTRSGFIQFTPPSDWASGTFGPRDAYYIRFIPSEDFSAGCTVQGMNLVYSDDQDLNTVYPGVLNYKHSGEASFILRHEAARDRIVQDVRNRGFRKVGVSGTTMLRRYANYDAWDVLDVSEVKEWAKYLALENIFSSLQSTEDGLYKQKAEEYRELAQEARAAFYLTLDQDDDGVADAGESSMDISSRRLVRR